MIQEELGNKFILSNISDGIIIYKKLYPYGLLW